MVRPGTELWMWVSIRPLRGLLNQPSVWVSIRALRGLLNQPTRVGFDTRLRRYSTSLGHYRPLYACSPLKNRFTIVKLKSTALKPMIASQALREPRHPRVALAWM